MEYAIRRAAARLDPHQPVLLTASMRDFISDSVANRRFVRNLLVITGCLALVMAVGTAPRDVLRLILRQDSLSVAVGLAPGIAASLLALSYRRSAVSSFETGHPASILIAACLVTTTAGVACWFPAQKAKRTDRISALRHE
jgi:hypothetical protein